MERRRADAWTAVIRSVPVALALFFQAAQARAQAEAGWPVNATMHFVIHHEKLGAALGDYNRIDQIYEALHDNLWSLSPWMATEKTHIYIYKDSDSYHRGRFNPPPWSGGLLHVSETEKAVVIFEPVDGTVVAHELTHLYFHAYFDEKKSSPPAWLDEGLACMLQNEAVSRPDPRSKGPVLGSALPLEAFLKTRPGADAPADWVGAWYLQAQSVVWFIKRGHIEGSFAVFCGKVRDGEDTETALREVYGYADLAAFEDAWRKWRPKNTLGLPVGLEGR